MTCPHSRRWLPPAAAVLALLGVAAPMAEAQQPRTLRVSMHADVRSLDPVWTTQTIATIHGNMIYDHLFAYDEKLEPQPQMVGDWSVSEDRKTYRFTLRDGLKFHDGTPVTTRDVLPSIRRWATRNSAGKTLMTFTEGLSAIDGKTFEWKLKEPYGLVLDTLARANSLVMMREKEALTDPFQQVTEAIGSGPFTFKRDEWVPGAKAVYAKFADYVPRKEAPSGHAGGKVVKVDRVEFIWLPDPQTAQAALVSGEIDFLENPQPDFMSILESTPGVKLMAHPAKGTTGVLQLNHLHPPFDNVKARQAMLHVVRMADIVDTIAPDPRFKKLCYSYLGCETPMETDAGSEAYKAAPDHRKAEQLFKEAGYKGEPITILHASDHAHINPGTQVLIQHMRRTGFLKLDVQAMDWGTVVSRRTKKEPPAQGGWNIFLTGTTVLGSSSPITHVALGMGCEKAWFGWPCDAKMEELRLAWSLAPDTAARKAIAVDISRRAYETVPFVPYGQWVTPFAYREDRISGVINVSSIPAMWNIERK